MFKLTIPNWFIGIENIIMFNTNTIRMMNSSFINLNTYPFKKYDTIEHIYNVPYMSCDDPNHSQK